VCTGLELEVGWLPILLQQSGNARIAAGQPGNLEAGSLVQRLEIPARLDRSDGDVHPGGNPHIQGDPRNIARVAEALARRLGELDAPNAAFYLARHKDFADRWRAASARWDQQAAPLKGVAVVVHHKNMSYMLNWLDMREAGALEPKPGIEPSAAHLSALFAQLQKQPARWCCARVTRTSARPNGSPSARRSRRWCCRSRSAAATARRTCSGCSTKRSRACSEP
jgi:zinc/manganese transport system substrate-binding protein